jgi:hypothetical protein
MAVSDMIAEAWKAVKDAGVPEGLQEIAFKEAMEELRNSHGTQSRGGSRRAETNSGKREEASHGVGSTKPRPARGGSVAQKAEMRDDQVLGAVLPNEELFAKFSSETGLAREALEEVFHFENGKPILNGRTGQLGSNFAEQSRTVAVALTAAYHYALAVRDVPVGRIAEECRRKNCYDVDNFSTSLSREKAITIVGSRGNRFSHVKAADTITALRKIVDAFRGIKVD